MRVPRHTTSPPNGRPARASPTPSAPPPPPAASQFASATASVPRAPLGLSVPARLGCIRPPAVPPAVPARRSRIGAAILRLRILRPVRTLRPPFRAPPEELPPLRSPRLSARPALRPPPRPWVAPRRYAVRSAAPRPSCVYSGAPRCVCLSAGCSGRRSREYALHCGLRTRTDLRNAPATSADPYPRPSRVPSFVPSFVRLPPSVLGSSASGLRASLRPALLLPAAAASGYGRADGAAPALRGAAGAQRCGSGCSEVR